MAVVRFWSDPFDWLWWWLIKAINTVSLLIKIRSRTCQVVSWLAAWLWWICFTLCVFAVDFGRGRGREFWVEKSIRNQVALFRHGIFCLHLSIVYLSFLFFTRSILGRHGKNGLPRPAQGPRQGEINLTWSNLCNVMGMVENNKIVSIFFLLFCVFIPSIAHSSKSHTGTYCTKS